MPNLDPAVLASVIAAEASNIAYNAVNEVLQRYMKERGVKVDWLNNPQRIREFANKVATTLRSIVENWGWRDVGENLQQLFNETHDELVRFFVEWLSEQEDIVLVDALARNMALGLQRYIGLLRDHAVPHIFASVLQTQRAARAPYSVELINNTTAQFVSKKPIETIQTTDNQKLSLHGITVQIDELEILPLQHTVAEHTTPTSIAVLTNLARSLLQGETTERTLLPPPHGTLVLRVRATERGATGSEHAGLSLTLSFATNITPQGIQNILANEILPFATTTFPRLWRYLSVQDVNPQHLTKHEHNAIRRWLNDLVKLSPQLSWLLSANTISHITNTDYQSITMREEPGTVAVHEHFIIATQTGATICYITFYYNIRTNSVKCELVFGDKHDATQKLESSAPLPPDFQITTDYIKQLLDNITTQHKDTVIQNLRQTSVHLFNYTNQDAMQHIAPVVAARPVFTIDEPTVVSKVQLVEVEPQFAAPNYSVVFTFVVPPDGYTDKYDADWARIREIAVTSTLEAITELAEDYSYISARTREDIVFSFADGYTISISYAAPFPARYEIHTLKSDVPHERKPLLGMLNLMFNNALRALRLYFRPNLFVGDVYARRGDVTQEQPEEPEEREQPLELYKSIYPVKLR